MVVSLCWSFIPKPSLIASLTTASDAKAKIKLAPLSAEGSICPVGGTIQLATRRATATRVQNHIAIVVDTLTFFFISSISLRNITYLSLMVEYAFPTILTTVSVLNEHVTLA